MLSLLRWMLPVGNFARLPAIDLVGLLPPGDWLHPDTPRVESWHYPKSFSWLGLVALHFVWALRFNKKESGDPQTRTWAMFSLFAIGPDCQY